MTADLPRLRILLEELEGQWRRLGLPVAQAAAPGATDAEITAAETATGLKLPDDVRTLYRWHNGLGGTDFARHGPAVAPGWYLFSLSEAAARYLQGRTTRPTWEQTGLDPEQFWPHGYFPIADSRGSATLVVATAGDPREPSPIDIVDGHVERPHWPLDPILPSLADLIEVFVAVLRDGWAYLDQERGVLGLRFKDMPRALLIDGLW
jgi:hypothetical protein